MHPYHSTNDAAVKVISHKNNNVKNKSHLLWNVDFMSSINPFYF